MYYTNKIQSRKEGNKEIKNEKIKRKSNKEGNSI
jgi:hypothetical protein